MRFADDLDLSRNHFDPVALLPVAKGEKARGGLVSDIGRVVRGLTWSSCQVGVNESVGKRANQRRLLFHP